MRLTTLKHAKTSSKYYPQCTPFYFHRKADSLAAACSLLTDHLSINIPLGILPSRTSAFGILSYQCIKPNTGTYTPARDIRILQSGNIRKDLERSRVIGAGWAS